MAVLGNDNHLKIFKIIKSLFGCFALSLEAFEQFIYRPKGCILVQQYLLLAFTFAKRILFVQSIQSCPDNSSICNKGSTLSASSLGFYTLFIGT